MGAMISILVRRWVTAVLGHLGNSDYLTGMLAMSAIGVGRDAGACIWRAVVSWLIRRFWATVRLEEKEAEILRAWLRERPEVHASSELAVYSRPGPETGVRLYEFEPEIETTVQLRVVRKDGRRQWIWVTQGARKTASVSFFGHNKMILETIFDEGREIQKRKRENALMVVQVYDYGGETGLHWLHPQERVGKQPGRPVSSVILPRCPQTGLDQAEALLQDAREFLASEKWYSKRGIPYRRGYLLYGVPGGGKSSLVMAMAHDLQLPIYMLSLSSEQMCDDKLNSLIQFGMHDPPTILLLEDVDLLHSAVLNRRDAKEQSELAAQDDSDKEKGSGSEHKRKKGLLTLSGLLNALDGPTATTGRLLFMTTNARDRLDPALVRSGRIDYEVEFKSAEEEQVQRLFSHFYSDLGAVDNSFPVAGMSTSPVQDPVASLEKIQQSVRETSLAFAAKVAASEVKLTTADIQRHLVKYKTDPWRAVEVLPELLQTFTQAKPGEKASNSVSSGGDAKDSGGDTKDSGGDAKESGGDAKESGFQKVELREGGHTKAEASNSASSGGDAKESGLQEAELGEGGHTKAEVCASPGGGAKDACSTEKGDSISTAPTTGSNQDSGDEFSLTSRNLSAGGASSSDGDRASSIEEDATGLSETITEAGTDKSPERRAGSEGDSAKSADTKSRAASPEQAGVTRIAA